MSSWTPTVPSTYAGPGVLKSTQQGRSGQEQTVRTQPPRSRKNRRNRKQNGGFEAAPVGQFGKELNPFSLAQGRQFADLNKNFHGGAFYGSAYPGSVTDSGLPGDLQASAHLLPLNKAFSEIQGLKDQTGGDYASELGVNSNTQSKCQQDYKNYTSVSPNITAAKYVEQHPECTRYVTELTPRGEQLFGEEEVQEGGRRRKASRKNRKVNRKNRKASRKNRKASRKSRKVNRKNRKASRKASRKSRKVNRKQSGGQLGSMPMSEFSKMLLPAGLEGKAGLNPEWKLAEDPNAFAPY